jgi:hypothetical protein
MKEISIAYLEELIYFHQLANVGMKPDFINMNILDVYGLEEKVKQSTHRKVNFKAGNRFFMGIKILGTHDLSPGEVILTIKK